LAAAGADPVSVSGEAPDGTSASAWATNDHADLRLISAARAVGEQATLRFGLEFRLAPGWKIYWRSPGDAGYPPRITWLERTNLAGAEISWPAPHRFSVLGLETMGYEGEVVLPIAATLAQPGAPLALRAKIDYLACSDICVPHEATLALALPAGPAAPTAFAHAIDRFAARVPGRAGAGEIAIERVLLLPGRAPALKVAAISRTGFAAPDLFVEGPEGFFFGAPAISRIAGGKSAELVVPVTLAKGALLDQLLDGPLTLTLVDDGGGGDGGDGPGLRAIEARIMPEMVSGGLATFEGVGGFALVLLLALAGGLILNLMPCVLPVLSLKLLAVVRLGGAARARVRREFLATSAGILVSFLVLAAAAIGLRQAGLAVGWGMQFQEPLFLLFMVAVLVLFAANLWGFFTIRLPGMSDLPGGASAPGGGQGHLGGAFVTGAFATLLATPCSAPFLGTAVGYALSRGPGETLAIFTFVGLGLSLPYLLVAAKPGLVAWLPRPGAWMVHVQRVLGLALAGTALWLLSVLWNSAGPRWAWLALGIALAAFAAFALGRVRPSRRKGALVAALALVLAIVVAPPLLPDRGEGTRDASAGAIGPAALWQPFDRAEIPALVAAGRTVVVDVTADWCVTCLVNKRLVLDQGEVAAWLARPEVAPRRADWTRPDDEIAAYLASFGRYGIPFNAVYGPGAPGGIVLPEVLTADAVLTALRRAGGGT